MIKTISFYLLVAFFVFAGANHFVSPEFYYPLIPDYLPFPKLINTISGIAEIGLGLLLLSKQFRIYAAYLLIVMLIAFIPSHIYFIMIGSCINDGLCVPEWIGWIRLIVIHPLLIYWVYSNRNYANK